MNKQDQLSVYFRGLSNHDLLTADSERELSQALEDTEILTWERILARADIAKFVLTTATVKLPKLKAALKGKKFTKKAMRDTATSIRATDLDRVYADTVIKEVNTTKDQDYKNLVHQAYRDASSIRDEFVRANLRLVVTMARRYDRGGMPLADLIQEGNLGLIHAVSRFDYRRGLRFSTYACWWIRHAIGRALADKARSVRIPVHMLEAQQHLDKARQVLVGELGRQPTPTELSKASRIPLAKINQMHRYILGQSVSLDRPVHSDDERTFGDTIADPTTEEFTPIEGLTLQTLITQLHKFIDQLQPIEAAVLKQRFGIGDDEELTFREIGDNFNLSRERIRQIQNNAMDKLKRAMEKEHKGRVTL